MSFCLLFSLGKRIEILGMGRTGSFFLLIHSCSIIIRLWIVFNNNTKFRISYHLLHHKILISSYQKRFLFYTSSTYQFKIREQQFNSNGKICMSHVSSIITCNEPSTKYAKSINQITLRFNCFIYSKMDINVLYVPSGKLFINQIFYLPKYKWN